MTVIEYLYNIGRLWTFGSWVWWVQLREWHDGFVAEFQSHYFLVFAPVAERENNLAVNLGDEMHNLFRPRFALKVGHQSPARSVLTPDHLLFYRASSRGRSRGRRRVCRFFRCWLSGRGLSGTAPFCCLARLSCKLCSTICWRSHFFTFYILGWISFF